MELDQVAILIDVPSLQKFLERAHRGEDPEALLIEMYANTDQEIDVELSDDSNEEPPCGCG